MRTITIFILTILSLLMQGGQQAVVVPVQNPSFEQFSSSLSFDQCGHWGGNGQGLAWRWQGSSGIFQPANPNPCGIEQPPDGQTVAYAQNGTISQDLGPANQYGIYTLKFSVANRFYWYPGTFKASILVGSVELCSVSGYAHGDFTEIPLVCTVHTNPGQWPIPPGNLRIALSSTSNWTLLFDKVSLTFAPG